MSVIISGDNIFVTFILVCFATGFFCLNRIYQLKESIQILKKTKRKPRRKKQKEIGGRSFGYQTLDLDSDQNYEIPIKDLQKRLNLFAGIGVSVFLIPIIGSSIYQYHSASAPVSIDKKSGQIAYFIPDSVNFGKDTFVYAAISTGKINKHRLSQLLPGRKFVVKDIRVTPIMTLKLINAANDSDFLIKPVSDITQVVGYETKLQWLWAIRQEHGKNNLLRFATKLHVGYLNKEDGINEIIDVAHIIVKESWWDQIIDFWKINSTILVTAGSCIGFFLIFFFRK